RIWHPVGKSEGASRSALEKKPGDLDGDHEFLLRAVRKVDTIREDLGCVGPVIAQQIEEAMLGRRRDMDTRDAEVRAAKAKRFVAAERQLQERISKLHQRLLDARNGFHLTPDRIAKTVSTALEIAGKPPLIPTKLASRSGDAAFEVPLLTGSWGQTTRGLEHPHTGKRRPITFDHGVAKGRDDVVLTHLNHRLVQMSLRLLRAEVWAHEDRRKLKRVAVRAVPKTMMPEPVVIIWSRLVITGGGHHRLHEELTTAGGELKASGFSRIRTLGRLEELLSASTPTDPPKSVFNVLHKRFKDQDGQILKAIEARSRERLEYLANTLQRRCRSEESDLDQVLVDLDKMIRKELSEAEQPYQAELFPTDEREQLNRDREALRCRLERIPEEREREIAAIRRRYAEPADRTFPVAVEFLVPEDFKDDR
ncbi:MAG: hypothetical protein L6Q38_07485, partial [Nitrospira sp.]|nr:hypothetical protein [Nitrospira sp.]